MPGGVANYYRTLRNHLDADKVYLEIGSAPDETGSWKTSRRMVADYWRFHQTLRSHSFDLVHINPSLGWRSVIRDGLLLLIARWHGQKVLVFFRGWTPSCEALIKQRFLWLFRSVYGQAAGFIVLGKIFQDALIAMGINRPIYRATTVADSAIFSGHGSEDADPENNQERTTCTILFLSRLDKGKGLAEAIEAFAQLKHGGADVALVIAGDGSERQNAEKLVREQQLTDIRFTGYIDGAEKDRIFRTADIFFFPTFFGEGMPNAVLEAMAYGLPIVTRPVGGIPDFFEEGRMGCVTDSHDPADFAAALARLIGNPELRRCIGTYNREYAAEHFSTSQVAKCLMAIYNQVVSSSAQR